MENRNKIECIYRIYRIQSPEGFVVEVESRKPLDEETNAKLLEKDEEIMTFFESHKIVSYKETKIPKEIKEIEEIEQIEQIEQIHKIRSKDKRLTPLQRLNHLLQMKGEFTRIDYHKYIEKKCNIKMSDFMGHSDIEAALKIGRIEELGTAGRHRLYKVLDSTEVDESLHKTLLKEKKVSVETNAIT